MFSNLMLKVAYSIKYQFSCAHRITNRNSKLYKSNPILKLTIFRMYMFCYPITRSITLYTYSNSVKSQYILYIKCVIPSLVRHIRLKSIWKNIFGLQSFKRQKLAFCQCVCVWCVGARYSASGYENVFFTVHQSRQYQPKIYVN